MNCLSLRRYILIIINLICWWRIYKKRSLRVLSFRSENVEEICWVISSFIWVKTQHYDLVMGFRFFYKANLQSSISHHENQERVENGRRKLKLLITIPPAMFFNHLWIDSWFDRAKILTNVIDTRVFNLNNGDFVWIYPQKDSNG